MEFPINRMKHIPLTGGIREIMAKADKMEAEGKEIIHLEIGRPDFGSPQVAIDGAIDALKAGKVHYADMRGLRELRAAIAETESKRLGFTIDPYTEIVVGIGAVECLAVTMLTIMDVGDEIILLTPCFPCYFDQAYLAGVVPVEVPLRFENGFKVDIDDIKKKITSKTKMILVNSPNNPTGMVMTKDDLEAIAKIALEHDLYVLSDEPYCEFLYSGTSMSIASLPGMRERSIVVNSVSKSFSMTGWRVGYMLANPKLVVYLTKTHQNLTTCVTTFAQYGAIEAYKHGAAHTKNMVAEFKRRRDMVLRYLDEMEKMEYSKPEGAFYVFPNISHYSMSPSEFCEYILTETGAALVPGDVFRGQADKKFIRICYANSYENVEKAMQRMKVAVAKL